MRSSKRKEVPIVDVFAGPGGLGEGFSRLRDSAGNSPFRIACSIEKDAFAHRTLRLRSFVRQFSEGEVPQSYYERLRGKISSEELFGMYPTQDCSAQAEAWQAELGSPQFPLDSIRSRLDAQLRQFRSIDRSVLIGGPPCQAYSLVGRSRNKGNKEYVFENDVRSRLYIEYLQLLADVRPAVFVMENVKGLLSSKHNGKSVFERILEDLQSPVKALHREGRSVRGREHTRYTVMSLDEGSLFATDDPMDYVVQCEKHGVPQARHRVILVGMRIDVDASKLRALPTQPAVTLDEVTCDLPRLRSGLSKAEDNAKAWKHAAREITQKSMINSIAKFSGADIADAIIDAAAQLGRDCAADRGGEFVEGKQCVQKHREWYVGDGRLGGFCNHATRAHIAADLHRYLFAAVFAKQRKRTPALADFPPPLRPAHENVAKALDGSMFADRFRVQRGDRPATTITSHISKDGHYYIHPCATQCRSLTVRVAALLRTRHRAIINHHRHEPRVLLGHNRPVPRQIARRNSRAACAGGRFGRMGRRDDTGRRLG